MTRFDGLRFAAIGAGKELAAVYRRTGADVHFGDPVPSHVAVALHPGGSSAQQHWMTRRPYTYVGPERLDIGGTRALGSSVPSWSGKLGAPLHGRAMIFWCPRS